MDELMGRAPAAHEHLAQIGPPLEEDLSAHILALNHESLGRDQFDFGPDFSQPIPEDERTPEQHDHHERVTGLMELAAGLTKEAHQVVVEHRKVSGEDGEITSEEILRMAKALALDTAEAAKHRGDREATAVSMRGFLALGLLQDRSARRDADMHGAQDARDAVRRGLANELIDGVQDLSGVVAVAGRDHTVESRARLYSGSRLLEVVTGRSLEDGQVVGAQRLQESEGILTAQDTIVLAQISPDRARAHDLAVQAVERLGHTSFETTGGEIAEVIRTAKDICTHPGSHEVAPEFTEKIAYLRSQRSAGNHYRINSSETYKLDSAIVQLLRRGEIDLAYGLLSSSSKEISQGQTDEETGRGIFDYDYLYDDDMTSDEVASIRDSVRKLHQQKQQEFRQELLNTGGDDSIAQKLIAGAHDPDSARDAGPEFWAEYKKWSYELQDYVGSSENIADAAHVVMGLIDTLDRVGISGYQKETLCREILSNRGKPERGGQIKELLEDSFAAELLSDEVLGDNEYAKKIVESIVSHTDTWLELSKFTQNGRESGLLRRQVMDRLRISLTKLNEDPTQAVRIFTELTVSEELRDKLRSKDMQLIRMLVSANNLRGFPSAKPGKIGEVFYDPDLAELYQKLYSFKQAGDVDSFDELVSSAGLTGLDEGANLTEFLDEIRTSVGEARDQEKAAKAWLRQYSGQDISANKLIQAWSSRSLALSRGIADNPTAIMDFVAEHGVRLLFEQKLRNGTATITEEEFNQELPTITALGARYSPHTALEALERRRSYLRERGSYPEKILTAHTGKFMVGDREYVAEILDKNDPRGFTIGVDTGCCMTLGGASESCIWAGFEDPRYSFFAVYDEGKLRAQSVMYVAEQEGRKILVVDNIEVNAGTDLRAITGVYRDALVTFIGEQKLNIDAIHIGVGYTQDELLAGLVAVQNPPATPLDDVYTDAAAQRVLWTKQ